MSDEELREKLLELVFEAESGRVEASVAAGRAEEAAEALQTLRDELRKLLESLGQADSAERVS